jgi:ribosomal protein S11
MISYNKQTSNIKLPFSMVVLFFYLLKKKYLRIHSLVSKYLQNNIIFTYLFTKSNTFINVMKSKKVLLFRSLGMLGFRKKKKKLQAHVNYLLGNDVINLFQKLYFKNNYKRLVIRLKGFRRFLRATMSSLNKYLGKVRYFFNNKMAGYKRWFNKKNRIVKNCFRRKKIYRMKYIQRKKETSIKRDRIKAIRQLLRVSFISYLSSAPFGGQNFGKKNIFERYVYKKRY